MNYKLIFFINHAKETSEPLIELSKLYDRRNVAILFESNYAFEKYSSVIDGIENYVINQSNKFVDENKSDYLISRKIIYPELERIEWWFKKTGLLKNVFKKQFNDIERIANSYFKSAIEGIEKLKGDQIAYLIYEPPSTALFLFLHHCVKMEKLIVVGMSSSRIKNKIELSNQIENFSFRVKNAYLKNLNYECIFSDESIKYGASVGIKPPEYFIKNNLRKKGVFNQLSKLFKLEYIYIIIKLKKTPISFQVGNYWLTSFGWFLNNLLMRINIKIIKSSFGKMKYDKQREYFVFPLHYHPEASTSVNAFGLKDDESFIEILRQCLPINHDLVVREHPNAIGIRGLSFYNNIKNMANVKLDFNTNVADLMRGAKGVITFGGTMGYEAAVAGCRVFNLTDSFYNISPNVVYCANLKDLAEKIIYFYNVDTFEDLRLAQSYYHCCSDGDIFSNINECSRFKLSLNEYIKEIQKIDE